MQIFVASNYEIEQGELNEIESKHCIRVLRKKPGDEIKITNGRGDLLTGRITNISSKKCNYELINKIHYPKTTAPLHIGIAPTKNNDRFEWFLEKVTEIGVDEITPIICQNSERKVIKIDRLNKILVAAMKQSLKAHLPKLNKAVSWKEFIKQKFNTDRFIAHCGQGRKTPLKQWLKPQQDVMILIGPEGDFSDTEVREAMGSGFVPVSLGKSRLRTETAAVAACHTISLINE